MAKQREAQNKAENKHRINVIMGLLRKWKEYFEDLVMKKIRARERTDRGQLVK